MHTLFSALRVNEQPDGSFSREWVQRPIGELPPGDLLVKLQYSSLNFKDALSATGNRGVTRRYPHTPGIDAAGIVAESQSPDFPPGMEVIVTSYDLGMNTDGGFAAYIRVPAAWAVPLPPGLNLWQSMALGTAGFTAGLALHKMEQAGQTPAMGPVLVSGASGGVGALAVALLARNGYEVIASSGKAGAEDWLKSLGASAVLSREAIRDGSGRPLLKSRWAGAVDTVGGEVLADILKATGRNGNVAVCGLVLSPELHTTVFPFILNGVNLLGIESAECPMPLRRRIWERLASSWSLQELLPHIAVTVKPEGLEEQIQRILKAQLQGRVVLEAPAQ